MSPFGWIVVVQLLPVLLLKPRSRTEPLGLVDQLYELPDRQS